MEIYQIKQLCFKGKMIRVMSIIDSFISDQINRIIHDKNFLKLESCWRGLWFMVSGKAHGTIHSSKKVSLFCMSEHEFIKDMNCSISFDQSYLFDHLYTQEYDMPGGQPHGLLILDYDVALDVNYQWYFTLEILSHIASACFMPVLFCVSTDFLGIGNLNDVNDTINWSSYFASSSFSLWQRFRKKEQSRYMNVLLQKYLYRDPYINRYQGDFNLQFIERIKKKSDLCWGSSVYLIGRLILNCFDETQWFNDIYLYSIPYKKCYGKLDRQQLSFMTRFHWRIPYSLEKTLINEGFTILEENIYDRKINIKVAQSIVFLPSSIHEMGLTSNVFFAYRLLPYVLCACRFAQYLKVIARDKVGSCLSADELEYQLQQWIHGYCGQVDISDQSRMAQYPLSSASIRIVSRDNLSGHYWCFINLKPNYRIELIDSIIKIVSQVKL